MMPTPPTRGTLGRATLTSVGLLVLLCALALSLIAVERPLFAEPTSAPAGAAAKKAPIARYSHRAHEGIGIKLKCEGCHGATSAGVLSIPGKDNHKPCANLACHAADFRKAGATICYTCHDHNEPWRANPTRTSLRRGGEFWVGFSHKNHLTRSAKGPLSGKGCVTCHPTQAGKPAPTRPAGVMAPQHTLCASCHESLAAPKMVECGGCHKLEDGPAVAKGDSPSKWRVNARFAHETHQVDPREAKVKDASKVGWARVDRSTAKELDCKTCHGEVLQAEAGARLPRPSMKGCATCHNGAVAFKATGFACTKCHGSGAPASASRPKP